MVGACELWIVGFRSSLGVGRVGAAQDVLLWLKDWGNAFNKAASQPSFLEHLQCLDKIEPSLAEHLQTYTPPMTSSHRDFERVCREFVESYFPGRFASYREFSAASSFRKKMLEHGLWRDFLEWGNQHVDFQRASECDGAIYKVMNQVAKRCLQFARPTKDPKGQGEQAEYTWADLAPRCFGVGFLNAKVARPGPGVSLCVCVCL